MEWRSKTWVSLYVVVDDQFIKFKLPVNDM